MTTARRDGSLEYLAAEHPAVRVLPMGHNTGFARAANRGLAATDAPYVALINTDVELEPDWTRRAVAALDADPNAAAVACKMVELAAPERIYDAGDVLRRDGACEQRGRFGLDDGSFDTPGEVFGACAGAALYRRCAVLAVGGFDERYFAYLEDVDLALAVRLAGWRCLYEPVVARHAGEGSSADLPGGHRRLVARNTLSARGQVVPRALAAFGCLPPGGLAVACGAGGAAHRAPARARRRRAEAPAALRARREVRPRAAVAIEAAVPAQPIRGPNALGHPSRRAGSRR